ncbi:hypothetical protein ACJRPK_05630 [Aquimarina sp. 2-A2]|uniref:hypothetical protein n=1 Tax=Aquimarina sp. 2-A2 TaxID=3382644 RepID=UPI00387F15B3
MKIKHRKSLIIIIYSTALLFILYFLVGVWLEHKIKDALAELKNDEIQISYSSVHVEPVLGNISLKSVEFDSDNGASGTGEKFEILGLSFWKLWKYEEIVIEEVTLTNANIYYRNKDKKSVEAGIGKPKSFDLNIEEINIRNARVHVGIDSLQKSSKTSFLIQTLRFTKINSNNEIASRKIPFSYGTYKGKIVNVRTVLDPYHSFELRSFTMSQNRWLADSLSITPLLSRSAFSDTLTQERDHMRLDGRQVQIESPELDEVDDRLIFTSNFIKLDQFNLDVYRDKRLPDDPSIKPMYSELLRTMNMGIAIDSIELQSGKIEYIEHLENADHPGKLSFNDLSMAVSPINTVQPSVNSEIAVRITSRFMNQAPIEIDWSFDVEKTEDPFSIRGNIKNVDASSMNAFIKPALNIEAEGSLDALYFNFSGNKHTAQGNTAMKFDAFDIQILKEDGRRKKSVLTFISNLIIDRKEDKGIVNERDIEVTRDKTKSFWNYFWLCIKNGLVETII